MNSHAYFHSVDDDHHVFINLQTLKVGSAWSQLWLRLLNSRPQVYILPDGYEVNDQSLGDIKVCAQSPIFDVPFLTARPCGFPSAQFALQPTFTANEVKLLDERGTFSYDLNNKSYLPGAFVCEEAK